MKKNLLSILILFLCLATFIMNAIMLFTQVSNTKKVNALIDKISTAISLEQNSGTASSGSSVPIDKQTVYQVNSGENMTANLASDGSSTSYVVSFSCSLSLNMESDNYVTYSPTILEERDDIIASDIISIMSSHTVEEVNNNQAEIQQEILEEMQNLFGSDYVLQINFPSIITTSM